MAEKTVQKTDKRDKNTDKRKGQMTVQFSELVAPLFDKKKHHGQGTFVITVLTKAGSTYLKAQSQTDRDYAAKIFRGERTLSEPIRESFQGTINRQTLIPWLQRSLEEQRNLSQTKFTDTCLLYGFPKEQEIDIQVLAQALAEQLQEILFNPDNDAPVITAAYEHYTETPDKPFSGITQPLIKGDRVLLSVPPALQEYRLPFYNEIEHTWTIQNTGKVSWDGRALRCEDPERYQLRPDKRIIAIEHLDQNRFIKLSTVIKARGEEGRFTSHWIMVDSNGVNCFPNEKSAFNIVIDVINPNLQQVAAEGAA